MRRPLAHAGMEEVGLVYKYSLIFALLVFALVSCAPGAIAPAPVYENNGLAAGFYPASTRAGHFDRQGFYISMQPQGMGLEVARGPWRGVLYGGYSGASGRVSWSQNQVAASLDLGYSSYSSWREVDTDSDGEPDTTTDVNIHSLGAALDVSYYFPVTTEIGSAYVAPRGRIYLACVQENNAAYVCNRFGLLPGAALGINVPLDFISERLTAGFEGSLFFVVPGITDRPQFSVFSPFAFTLSYRF